MIVTRNKHKIEIENLQLEVFKLLQEKLCYAYSKKNGKEYFLKKNYLNYDVKDISEMRTDLVNYIKNNFEKLDLENEITLEEVLNVIYHKKPVTKKYARNFLGYNSRVYEEDYKIENDRFIII